MREVQCLLTDEADDGFGVVGALRVVVEGPVDERTGFVCHIQEIDAMVRGVVMPALRARLTNASVTTSDVVSALKEVFPEARERCPTDCKLTSLELALTPFTRFTLEDGEQRMVQVTQSFEFSAAHRLYCNEMSEEENRRVFGKCSHHNGHGHNYVLEVTLCGTPDKQTGRIIDLRHFVRSVNECVIEHFDHKHLNLDCPEFSSLNPSVENIARVIWNRLEGVFEPEQLAKVRVWETPKTYAEYSGR